jgi:hypothetical protein
LTGLKSLPASPFRQYRQNPWTVAWFRHAQSQLRWEESPLKPDAPATTAIARPAADAKVPAGAQQSFASLSGRNNLILCHSLRWGLRSSDLFRALAGLIREPHLTAAFRLDCKYVTLAATLSHPLPARPVARSQ